MLQTMVKGKKSLMEVSQILQHLDSLYIEGVQKICEEMNIDPSKDAEILVLVYFCECYEYGEITKTEFKKGIEKLHCDSLKSFTNRYIGQKLIRIELTT
ncbi:MAG: hypothetical protein ACI857_003314 [Arenicella sp.]|jgi:hypothetical protein